MELMRDNSYNYCVGTNNLSLRSAIIRTLSEAGFKSSGEAKNIADFLRTLRMLQPWLAIIDTALPPGNINELINIIKNDSLAATICINTNGINMDEAISINWPFEKEVLIAVSTAVCHEFAHIKSLNKKIESLQNQLVERKIIEKAKGILIKTYLMEEGEAFRLIQSKSMEHRIPMAKLSLMIIKDPFYTDNL